VVEVEEAAVVGCEAAVLLRVHADVSVLDEEVEGSACRLVADELRRVEGVAGAADGTGTEAADLNGAGKVTLLIVELFEQSKCSCLWLAPKHVLNRNSEDVFYSIGPII
jgi:hypothetical protein